jgi:hypothetical protein
MDSLWEKELSESSYMEIRDDKEAVEKAREQFLEESRTAFKKELVNAKLSELIGRAKLFHVSARKLANATCEAIDKLFDSKPSWEEGEFYKYLFKTMKGRFNLPSELLKDGEDDKNEV